MSAQCSAHTYMPESSAHICMQGFKTYKWVQEPKAHIFIQEHIDAKT